MDKKLPRGVFRRGNDFWIRYTDQYGRLHREKVGPFFQPARDAVEKRRSNIREAKFFPDKLRQRAVLFGEIAKDYLNTRRSKRDFKHDEDRVELLLEGRKPKRKDQAPRSAGTPRLEPPADPQGPGVLKNVPISELTPGRLEGELAGLAEEYKWAPATYNRYRAVLSGVFRCGHQERQGQNQPGPGDGTPQGKQRPRPLPHG